MWFFPFVKGVGLGASLIIAIGSQNAFVLSNALRKQHTLTIASVCIVIDVVLIFSGVYGLGSLIQMFPFLIYIAKYCGALFLIVYGGLAMKRAFNPQGLSTDNVKKISVKSAVLVTMALSLLNPHVYLDTVILLGSIGGQLPDGQSFWFALGASVASICWFLVLALAGVVLAPWFKSAKSWQKLDAFIAVTMWVIAAFLLNSTF